MMMACYLDCSSSPCLVPGGADDDIPLGVTVGFKPGITYVNIEETAEEGKDYDSTLIRLAESTTDCGPAEAIDNSLLI